MVLNANDDIQLMNTEALATVKRCTGLRTICCPTASQSKDSDGGTFNCNIGHSNKFSVPTQALNPLF